MGKVRHELWRGTWAREFEVRKNCHHIASVVMKDVGDVLK